MTALDTSPEATEAKRPRKPRPKPTIDAAAVLEATKGQLVQVGDIVLYRLPAAARQSLKSNRGLDAEAFPAMVTFVFPGGQVSLTVFRPFGLSQVNVHSCAYSAEDKPDTFGLRK